MRLTIERAVLLLIPVALLAGGCGLKGDLYLEDAETAAPANSASDSPSPTTAPASGSAETDTVDTPADSAESLNSGAEPNVVTPQSDKPEDDVPLEDQQ